MLWKAAATQGNREGIRAQLPESVKAGTKGNLLLGLSACAWLHIPALSLRYSVAMHAGAHAKLLPAGNSVGGQTHQYCTGVAFSLLLRSISTFSHRLRPQPPHWRQCTAAHSRTEPFDVPAQTSCRLEDLHAYGAHKGTRAYQRCDVLLAACTYGTSMTMNRGITISRAHL